MAVPFPEAQLEALIYMSLGALLTLVIFLAYYIRRLHTVMEDDEEEFRVDNIGLSKKSQDVMKVILEESELQSDVPDRLNVSKATVSNAVSELKERGLVKRKKRANTYLLEPDMEELERQQR